MVVTHTIQLSALLTTVERLQSSHSLHSYAQIPTQIEEEHGAYARHSPQVHKGMWNGDASTSYRPASEESAKREELKGKSERAGDLDSRGYNLKRATKRMYDSMYSNRVNVLR
jgi:hypothetical protein